MVFFLRRFVVYFLWRGYVCCGGDIISSWMESTSMVFFLFSFHWKIFIELHSGEEKSETNIFLENYVKWRRILPFCVTPVEFNIIVSFSSNLYKFLSTSITQYWFNFSCIKWLSLLVLDHLYVYGQMQYWHFKFIGHLSFVHSWKS